MFGPINKTSWLKNYKFADHLDSVDSLRLRNLFSIETNKTDLIEELFKNESFLNTVRANPYIPVNIIGEIAAVLEDAEAEILLEKSFYESPIFDRMVLSKSLDQIDFSAETILKLRTDSKADIYDIVEEKAENIMEPDREGQAKLTILSNMREFLLPEEKERFDRFLKEKEVLFVNKSKSGMRIAFTKAVQSVTGEETIHPFIYTAGHLATRNVWAPYQKIVKIFEESAQTDTILFLREEFKSAREKAGDDHKTYQAAQHAIEHCRLVLARLPQTYNINL